MNTPPDYTALAAVAQRLVATDLSEALRATGEAPMPGCAPRISRLAMGDVYETLLARIANDFAAAPDCPLRLESAARQFVLAHLQATLLTWLAGATRTAAETSVVGSALARLGLPLPT